MPNQFKSIPINNKTLDDKTFQSHLFKIVALPILVIFIILGVSHFEDLYRDKLRDNIENYDLILLNVVRLEKSFADMETAERGFVISGQNNFLDPYRQSQIDLPHIEDQLFKLIGADFKLNSMLRLTLDQFREWMTHSEKVITFRKNEDLNAAESLSENGNDKFLKLRDSVGKLRKEVEKERNFSSQKLKETRQFIFFLEMGIVLFLMVFLGLVLIRQLKNLTQSYRDLLEVNFANTAAVEQASKAKDLFLANMSHEIRTPLGAIMGFAELIGQNQNLDALSKNHIAFIRRNSEHLLNLIDDLFDLSKVNAEKIDISIEKVDLLEFIDDLKNLYSSKVSDKKLNLNVVIQDNIPRAIKTDPVRLKQIVSNIVGNAIKFSPSGTKIDVIFGIQNEELIIDVIDQGVGISESAQKIIFESFRQADFNHSRKYGGAGLGLSISKKLAQILKGDVMLVESKPQVGSHFQFRLPIEQEGNDFISKESILKESSNEATETVPEKIYLNDVKVLLAEDSKENQILFKIFVESSGAGLTIVENGTEAVRKSLDEDYDVILMDIQMPGLDGYEAVRILRGAGYEGKIVALTAHTMKGEKEKCLSSGFDDYLSKPISQFKLLQTIKNNLEKTI